MIVKVLCSYCVRPVYKDSREVNRSQRLGRKMFCNLSCSKLSTTIRAEVVTLTCPCGRVFVSSTKARAPKHCSRECASRYSMSDERREAQRLGGLETRHHLLPEADVLRLREGWKYAELLRTVEGTSFQFEYELGWFIYDLALFDRKIIVEFDGPYHLSDDQRERDDEKERVAIGAGFTLLRRRVPANTVIDPAVLAGII